MAILSLKLWLLFTIPAAIVCGLCCGMVSFFFGKDVMEGIVGGSLGITIAFPLIGVWEYIYKSVIYGKN